MPGGNETTLETMVVRLVGDMSGYLDTLKKAQTDTKQGIDSLVAEGERLTERFKAPAEKYTAQLEKLQEMYAKGTVSAEVYVKALRELEKTKPPETKNSLLQDLGKLSDGAAGFATTFAGKVQAGLGMANTALALSKEKFNSTGEELKMIGSIASAIPGPWGAAAGAVLGVAGSLVDYFQGPLLRSQENVRNAFQGMASGAMTAGQAMSSLATGRMQEGLDQLVRSHQNEERGGFRLQMPTFEAAEQQAFDNTRQQMIERLGREGGEQVMAEVMARRVRQRIEQDQERFRRMMGTGTMTGLRVDLAATQISQETVNRAEELPIHGMQRRLMRAQHGEGGGPAEVQQLNEQLAVMRLINRTRDEDGRATITYAQAQERVGDAVRRSNQLILQDMQRRRTDQAVEGVTEFNKKIGEQVQAGSRAIATFQTFGQSVDGSRDAMGLATTTTESLQRQQELYVLGLDRRDVMERLSAANTDNLSAAMRRQLEQRLRTIDAGMAELGTQDRVRTAMELQRNALQAGYQITQQARTPVEVYTDRLAELRNVLDRNGTSITAHARAVQQASEAYQRADPTLRLYLSDVEQGVSIANQFRTHMEGTADQVQALDRALASGRITSDEHARALGGIAEQLGRVNGELHGTPAAARGSAEALARITAYQERLRAGVMNEGQLQRFREIARPRDQERLRQQGEQARQEQLMLAEVFEEEQGEARRETQRQHQEFLADWWQEQQAAATPAREERPGPAEHPGEELRRRFLAGESLDDIRADQARRAGNPVPGGGNAGGGDVGGGVPGGGDAGGGDVGGGDWGNNAPAMTEQLRQAVELLRVIANSGEGFFGAGLGT